MITYSINAHPVIALMFSQTGTDVLPRRDEGSDRPSVTIEPHRIMVPTRTRTQAAGLKVRCRYHYTTAAHICHYVCFLGQWIYCRHSYKATMFGWPRKFRSTSGTRGTQRYWWLCPIDFWNFFNMYVFEVKKSISDIHSELPCSGDLENLGNYRYKRHLKVLMIVSYRFLKFLHYICFRSQGIHFWHSY